MGRSDDALPEIEVLGPAGSMAAPTVVQRGSSGGSGPSGRMIALIGGAVLVLLVAGRALGGIGDGEEAEGSSTTTSSPTSTTRRSTATSTSTTMAPVGPLFGEPTGTLLVVSAVGSWTVVDADTGRITEAPDLGAWDGGFGAVGLRDGVALLEPSRNVTYWNLRQDPPRSTPLGLADQVLPSVDGDAVWLVDAHGYVLSGPQEPQVVRLVGLDGQERRRAEVPAYVGISGATEIGPVGAGGGRVYVFTEDGAHTAATGELLGVSSGLLVVRSCDEEARCRIDVVDPVTGAHGHTEVPADGGVSTLDAPHGQVGLLRYPQAGPGEVWLLDRRGHTLARGDWPSDSNGSPSLLPGSLGWVYTDPTEQVTRLVRHGDALVVELLPAIAGVRAQTVVSTVG